MRRTTVLGGLTAVLFLLGACTSATSGAGSAGTSPSPPPGSSASCQQDTHGCPGSDFPDPSGAPTDGCGFACATDSVPDASFTEPTAEDFAVTVKILSKHCFGEAGCNITYRVNLAMDLPTGSLDPTVTYDVTYEITGVEDGPIIDTLTVNGDQYDAPSEEVAQLANSGSKVRAKVTDVQPE